MDAPPSDVTALARLRVLARLLTASVDLDEVLGKLLRLLAEDWALHRVALSLADPERREIAIEAAHGLTPSEVRRGRYAFGEGIVGRVATEGEAMVVRRISSDAHFVDRTGAFDEGIERAFVCVPVRVDGKVLGTLSAYREPADDVVLHQLEVLLHVVAAMLAPAVEHRVARHGPGVQHGPDDGPRAARPAHIIGSSKPMQRVFDLIDQVAQSNTTVLLRGESGTGKELVADAVHRGSGRARGAFVKVNCAALPESIIESELFGHERGAFTGAVATRKGRFEQADGGTLFLDEIGDLSPQTQVKLLRVLQQRELERVGSNRTLSVDVRVITATSRDLEKMLETGEFRQDLYYRLNVFPIHVPALRERKADIVALADHFVEVFDRVHGKRVRRISTPAIDMLVAYHWPGNVRELENCIERAVLLTRDDVIHAHHLPPSLQTAEASDTAMQGTLKELLGRLEKDLVLDALKSSRGNMASAARQLGITERIMGLRVEKYAIDPQRFKGGATTRS